ncbi:hypothetical protein OVA24_18785 [Luteolibacter sp. SL250]|uniref:hypothetical protein n=1 Tax=Luteolibacter sp. SL250 TaxID=2995170 RepID=UPI00226FA0EC|nr:hypothetical protein [Luteolibacter sp. SL250]WAC19276.1 hypothetical protein OVA24_18785 [Luteolibacter sp. SL250]
MDSTPDPLIRTRYKGPLAKGTSYPSGAELLSSKLSGVPQYNELEIGFYGEKSQKFLMNQDDFPILRIEYQRVQASYSTSNCDSAQSRLEPNWRITVYPIVSINRKKFRDYLDASGWNLIRTWLIDAWRNNGRLGKASLIISACQNTNEFKHVTEMAISPAKS